jgi:mRNA-degrading endonuclease RelE of RelBE toxin-antitoxin system
MIKLPYRVVVEKKVDKFISKLDKEQNIRVLKKLVNLEDNPIPKDKKHIIDTKGAALLCEFTVDKLRFYYEISNGIIWINEVQFAGEVKVISGYANHKSGNKQNNPNQRRDIGFLRKLFGKKE